MTGGLVLSLGGVGYNFGAGMTGGIAYLLDDGRTRGHINTQLVNVEALDADDEACLQGWLALHAGLTGSPRAKAALANWAEHAPRFLKIVPKDQPAPERPIPVLMPEHGPPVRAARRTANPVLPLPTTQPSPGTDLPTMAKMPTAAGLSA